MTVAQGGVLIVGSASSPFVYKVRSASATAEKFVDASAEGPGTFFFGMLADASTNTLWTCQLTPVPGKTPVQRHTALRSFDLESGAPKIRWNLPGDNGTCNDFAIGPDKALYITDTANSKIYKLPSGASTAAMASPSCTGPSMVELGLFLDLIWTLRPRPLWTARQRSHAADQLFCTLRAAPDRLKLASGSSSRKGV